MAKKPNDFKKRTRYVTPKATFVWPKLVEPDYGTTQYPNPDGGYSVKVRMNSKDPAVKKFLEAIKVEFDAAKEHGEEMFGELPVKNRKELKDFTFRSPISPVYDEETEEATDEIEFKISMKASGEYRKGPKAGKRWERKPILFDAGGQRMNNPPPVGGGSVGKVSFTCRPYFVSATGVGGVSFDLEGVQIIDLVQYGGRSADEYGFGEEDGYSHEDAPLKEAEATTPENEDVDF